MFRFIITDEIGMDSLKIGPHTCYSGREILLCAEEIEQWLDAEDYEDGYVVFLGTVNGSSTKSQVEDMIFKKSQPKPKQEDFENVGTTGFEFPE